MDTATRERISEGQRRRWAERRREQQRVATQLEATDVALERYRHASASCFAALERHESDDPLAAYALQELRAAFDEIELSNLDAVQLLADHGLPDPTQPAARTAGGDIDDADARRVTRG